MRFSPNISRSMPRGLPVTPFYGNLNTAEICWRCFALGEPFFLGWLTGRLKGDGSFRGPPIFTNTRSHLTTLQSHRVRSIHPVPMAICQTKCRGHLYNHTSYFALNMQDRNMLNLRNFGAFGTNSKVCSSSLGSGEGLCVCVNV